MSVERERAGAGLSRGMVALFAVACGLAVANLYYTAPLLTAIATTFGVGSAAASTVVMVTQIGYAMGLALIVPLGDVTDRRRLVVVLLLIVAGAQAVSAVAPTLGVLLVSTGVLAFTTVVGPILVSFAATLAAPAERGRVSGRVVSGLLVGILLARTGGGFVAQWWGGWRSVYAAASVLMVVLAAVLARRLPHVPPATRMRYPALLRSVGSVVRREPLLRLRCLYGFLVFATFNVFWTSMAFLVARPPYAFDQAVIGLFGLAGAAGAWAAGLAGRLADTGADHAATGAFLLAILASWVPLGLHGGRWLVALVLGVVLLDFGAQAVQVTNLSVIYRLSPELRSRITTAYMVAYFLGGVAGAAASGVAYAWYGWRAVCWVGAGIAGLALLVWVAESTARRRAARSMARRTADLPAVREDLPAVRETDAG